MLYFRRFSSVVAIVMLFLTAGPTISQTLEGNDDSIPRDLVLRLLNLSRGEIQQEQSLLIGQLPENLPVDLPLPDGAKVVASVVASSEYYRVLLDVPQSPDQVKLFYQEQLEAAGWQRQPFYFVGFQGFVPSEFEQTEELSFCRDTTGPVLRVIARSAQESTDLRLNLNIDVGGSCGPQPTWTRDIPIPTLVSPPGSHTSSQRSGFGSDHRFSRADLETELEVESLMAHYDDQWEQAGWVRITSNQTDRTFWSLWRLQDEAGQPWQGILSIQQVEEMPNQYETMLIVIEQ